MTNEQFKDLLDKLEINSTEAGSALGVTSATIANYKSGKYPIPKAVSLAMEALFHRKHLDKSIYEEE